MRLIDADALRANLYREVFGTPSLQRLDNSCYVPYRMFEDALRKTPNVDAVTVIRCGECKNYDADDKSCIYSYPVVLTEGDFCSRGERKEEQ